MTKGICSVQDCMNYAAKGELCGKHYIRKCRYGDIAYFPNATINRVLKKIEKTSGCWLWTGSIDGVGYGRIWNGIKMTGAHRVVYELLVGPIPDGLQLDHLCRVRHCVNPSHLEPVTCRENLLRGVGVSAKAARQTHCIHGHELTEENIYRWGKRPNARYCKICIKIRNDRNTAKVRAKREEDQS